MWSDGIVKIALETLDYGTDFPPAERYDYQIATFTADGHKDFMPGVCESKLRMRKKVKEMAAVITIANNSPCKIGEDVNEGCPKDYNKRQTLVVRKTRNDTLAKAKKAQRKRDNGLGR